MVAEVVFPDVIPQMLGGIEFGTVRRQKEEAHRAWDTQGMGLVPAGSVHNNKADIVGKLVLDVREEDGHRFRIEPGHNEGDEPSVSRTNGGERIDVLPDNLVSGDRAFGQRRPAAPGVADAPEPAFIFEQKAQPFPFWDSLYNRPDRFREFFLKAACFEASDLTW